MFVQSREKTEESRTLLNPSCSAKEGFVTSITMCWLSYNTVVVQILSAQYRNFNKSNMLKTVVKVLNMVTFAQHIFFSVKHLFPEFFNYYSHPKEIYGITNKKLSTFLAAFSVSSNFKISHAVLSFSYWCFLKLISAFQEAQKKSWGIFVYLVIYLFAYWFIYLFGFIYFCSAFVTGIWVKDRK